MRTYISWALALLILSACLSSVEGQTPGKQPRPLPGKRRNRNAVYYANWNTFFAPYQIPVEELTHIFYAFSKLDKNGTVYSGNPEVDVLAKNFTTTIPEEEQGDNNVYGVVRELFLYKVRQRNLKVYLSIGGGGALENYQAAAATDDTRDAFAVSALQLITDWGFDGIDIDWEYPTTAADSSNFVALLQAIRNAFDNYSFIHRLKYRFGISVTISSSTKRGKVIDIASMIPLVNYWNLLAYDYSGNYSDVATHQSNVFAVPNLTELDTDGALDFYIGKGIDAYKISLGVPLYGRSFENTAGLGQPYSGVGPGGPRPPTVEQRPGIWHYNQLPRDGATEMYDDKAQASYSYDPDTREFITYDNVQSTLYKAKYLAGRGLGGAVFFQTRSDRTGPDSLISTMNQALGRISQTPNNIEYPTSKYDNIRSGMPWVNSTDPSV